MKEIWKDIPGYEGLYQISDLGKVKSLFRYRSDGHKVNERILKPQINTHKYHQVGLYKNKTCKLFSIHVLVARLFLPEYCEKLDVDHIDTNRIHNNVTNLRMSTRAQNSANARKQANTSSHFKCVSWSKVVKKWHAYISVTGGKRKHLGYFVNEEDAARAYDKKALELFGEFARTNEMLGLYNKVVNN